MADSELLDTSIFYGSVAGVERWIRNKDFASSADLDQTDVQSLLESASETIDTRTNMAWRERRVNVRELRVRISAEQRDYYKRRGGGRRVSPAGFLEPIDPWAMVTLPHHFVDIDPNATNGGEDSIEVLGPRGAVDITANEGRDGGDWHLDERRGVLYVDLGELAVGPVRGGGLVSKPRVRVTYRYGYPDPSSTSIPDDIDEAANKWVAASLTQTDSYGGVIGGGGGAVEQIPNLSSGADGLLSDVQETLQAYRGVNIL